jgi:hypothetical protein
VTYSSTAHQYMGYQTSIIDLGGTYGLERAAMHSSRATVLSLHP